ncbi:MAG: hypothetical protein ABH834_04040 [Candidatus Altiarchaeota archaeon]
MAAPLDLTLYTINPLANPVSWLTLLVSAAIGGDLMAATLLLMLSYLALLILNKLTDLLITIARKLMVLAVIVSASYYFVNAWIDEMKANPSVETVLIGIAGLLVGAAAVYASSHSLAKSARKANMSESSAQKEATQTTEGDELLETKNELATIRQILSAKALRDDKSLGTVLAYMAIAQFGIFSSKTISAPTPTVGLLVFSLFLAAMGFFIKLSYKNFRVGVRHAAVALILGFALSVVLGATWGQYPLAELLSLNYFSTDSLVALMTGITLSLFMGSR